MDKVYTLLRTSGRNRGQVGSVCGIKSLLIAVCLRSNFEARGTDDLTLTTASLSPYFIISQSPHLHVPLPPLPPGRQAPFSHQGRGEKKGSPYQ
jgi:hypothetical protein